MQTPRRLARLGVAFFFPQWGSRAKTLARATLEKNRHCLSRQRLQKTAALVF